VNEKIKKQTKINYCNRFKLICIIITLIFKLNTKKKIRLNPNKMQKKGKTVSFLLKSVGTFDEMKDTFEINLRVFVFLSGKVF